MKFWRWYDFLQETDPLLRFAIFLNVGVIPGSVLIAFFNMFNPQYVEKLTPSFFFLVCWAIALWSRFFSNLKEC
jgi:hypothetical protein